MNKILLKQTAAMSVIVGAALGIFTLIPYLGNLTFIILICFTSAAIILFMLKLGLIEKLSVKESVILGGVIGFISFIVFCVVYLPIVALFGKVFGAYQFYGVSLFLQAGSIGLIIMMVIFMGVLAATINAFSAFLTFYVIEFIQSLNKDSNYNNYKNNEEERAFEKYLESQKINDEDLFK